MVLMAVEHIIKPCSVKKGLNALIKSINPCEIAQSITADMDRNFSVSQAIPCFYMSALQVFENIVVKGEMARNEQFSPFTAVFSSFF